MLSKGRPTTQYRKNLVRKTKAVLAMKTTHLSTRKSGGCALFENATRISRLIAFSIT